MPLSVSRDSGRQSLGTKPPSNAIYIVKRIFTSRKARLADAQHRLAQHRASGRNAEAGPCRRPQPTIGAARRTVRQFQSDVAVAVAGAEAKPLRRAVREVRDG